MKPKEYIIEGVYDDYFRIINIENSRDIDIAGTSMQGYLNTTYNTLVKTFGEPTFSGDDIEFHYNSEFEWNLRFVTESDVPGDGLIQEEFIGTIYNKSEPVIEPDKRIDWNVGGNSSSIFHIIKEAINPPHPLRYLRTD